MPRSKMCMLNPGRTQFSVLRTLELPSDYQLVTLPDKCPATKVSVTERFGVKSRTTGYLGSFQSRFRCLKATFVRWLLRKLRGRCAMRRWVSPIKTVFQTVGGSLRRNVLGELRGLPKDLGKLYLGACHTSGRSLIALAMHGPSPLTPLLFTYFMVCNFRRFARRHPLVAIGMFLGWRELSRGLVKVHWRAFRLLARVGLLTWSAMIDELVLQLWAFLVGMAQGHGGRIDTRAKAAWAGGRIASAALVTTGAVLERSTFVPLRIAASSLGSLTRALIHL
jgi:hypothetical protein